MPSAIWHGAMLASSDNTIVIEGNHYFPPQTVNRGYFRDSSTHTVCGWKGTASYYDVVVGEAINRDAAWCYPQPKPAVAPIADYVAFWKGVEIG